MNYRHGYHAGNFADVLKHTALCELLRLLTAKDKKLFVLDTHAGAGGYALGEGPARRTGEADAGIARLVSSPRAGMPPAVVRYLAAVAAYDRKFGPVGAALQRYPGSPRLVRMALRPGDRFTACELHPAEALALKREFAGDRAVEVRQADGYKVLKALLPPPERRGLVLIDPPFETDGRVRAPAARAPPGRAALRDRLLRALVSDQGRGRRRVRRRAGGVQAADPGIAPGGGRAGQARRLRARRHQSAMAFRGGDAGRAALDRRAPRRRRHGRGFRPASQRAGSGIVSVMAKDTRQRAAPASMTPV